MCGWVVDVCAGLTSGGVCVGYACVLGVDVGLFVSLFVCVCYELKTIKLINI